jgi:hypothetical protein
MAATAAMGLLTWAWQLEGAGWWVAAVAGTVVAGWAAAEALLLERRRLAVTAAASAGAAALAALTWRALVGPGLDPSAGAALAAGLLSGLAATPALALAHVEWMGRRRVARALAEARAGLAGDERTLAERAAAAHDRIAATLGAGADLTAGLGADSRQLRRLTEDVTLQVLALAHRCGRLRGEVERIDFPAVRRRASALADEAAGSVDDAARADLTRAARAVIALDQRAQTLAGAAARVRARLELQVALLEDTALAVATRQASNVVGEADALAPLAERLHEAGRDLHDQAAALAEASGAAA